MERVVSSLGDGHLPSDVEPGSTPQLEARVRDLERQVEELRLAAWSRRTWREKFRPTLFIHDQYPPREWSVPQHYFSTILPIRAPSIALVTPSLNQGEYVERTIRSVLTQGYPALRYTVQDGGSSDETNAVQRKFEGQISWVTQRDDGQAHAINLGFARVEGDIMGWLNSDDMMLPGTLAYVARFFCDHPGIDVVYGHRIYINKFDKEIGRMILPRHDPEAIKWADFIPQETMFWRRRVWDKLGGLDQSFHFALDWDFILRAHAAGFRFCRLPRFLGCFRVHHAQKTTSMLDVGKLEMARLREQHVGRSVNSAEVGKAIRPYLRRHVLMVRAHKLRLAGY